MSRTEPDRLRIRRAHAPPEPGDGTRILVDRLWPRGLSRRTVGIDHWVRDVAPSDALRRWYGHAADRWPEFRRRYFAELDANPAGVAALREKIGASGATLVFAARDAQRSNAAALREYLSGQA